MEINWKFCYIAKNQKYNNWMYYYCHKYMQVVQNDYILGTTQ